MEKEYTLEEAVERHAAFDALGLEPDEIKKLIPTRFARKPVIRTWIASFDEPGARALAFRMSYDCPSCKDDGRTCSLLFREKRVAMDYCGIVTIDNDFTKDIDKPKLPTKCARCGQLIDWGDFDPYIDLVRMREES